MLLTKRLYQIDQFPVLFFESIDIKWALRQLIDCGDDCFNLGFVAKPQMGLSKKLIYPFPISSFLKLFCSLKSLDIETVLSRTRLARK
jgi:hypothetical protein